METIHHCPTHQVPPSITCSCMMGDRVDSKGEGPSKPHGSPGLATSGCPGPKLLHLIRQRLRLPVVPYDASRRLSPPICESPHLEGPEPARAPLRSPLSIMTCPIGGERHPHLRYGALRTPRAPLYPSGLLFLLKSPDGT